MGLWPCSPIHFLQIRCCTQAATALEPLHIAPASALMPPIFWSGDREELLGSYSNLTASPSPLFPNQKRCKEQEAERAQSRPVPVKALWTSSKYENIPSRVMAQLQVFSPTVKPQCQNFLKAHSHVGSAALPITQSKPSPAAVQRPDSRNSTPDLQLQIQGQTIDFIKHNARAARKTGPRRSQSLTNLQDKPVPSAVKGQVPQYLEERKEQWRKEKEEKRRNVPDPTVPAGHTLMPESERQQTLTSLKETHRSLVTELLSLPLKGDNLSLLSRRAHLDCRLSEIEEAIKIFSRDKVYIKINS
ncbi:enkurin domain-containing protein 1 isoform X2 [Brachyistius frenatus]|uniref:enkurin domain-containing protein 1 isoform X2 n=1 Tax=Brachyistius frenatus TaxID=100188 RepID=UPI0037E7B811